MTAPRVALVVGAGRKRIGNSIACDLAKCGFRVAVHYHRSRTEALETVASLRDAGMHAFAVRANLESESEVTRLIHRVRTECGRLDVLVCTAAIWEAARLEDTSLETLRRHWAVNVAGTFLCCKLAGFVMADQPEGGSIVVLGDWAICRPYPDYSAYLVAKGAIPTLVRTFAVELGLRNPRVRVNGILPGPVMLPDEMPADVRHAVADATLVRREGAPQHVAHAVRFLIENDFVTGACIPVDGGRSVFAPDHDRGPARKRGRPRSK
jgi:pteridine reductase